LASKVVLHLIFKNSSKNNPWIDIENSSLILIMDTKLSF
jgi:hypothetical protein